MGLLAPCTKINTKFHLKLYGFSRYLSTETDFKVYNTQNHFVDDDALISAVRHTDDIDKSGEISINPEWTIDEFEKKIMEFYGVKVQVYTPDESKLADNNIKLFWGNN